MYTLRINAVSETLWDVCSCDSERVAGELVEPGGERGDRHRAGRFGAGHPFVGDDVSVKLERADMNVNAVIGLKGGLTGGFITPLTG